MAWSLSIDAERDHERSRLRIVEVVDPLRRHFGATEVRFRIDAGVGAPCREVPRCEPKLDAAQALTAHPRCVERVREGDLAELDVAAVLEELRRLVTEPAAKTRIPVLADRDSCPIARPERRTLEEILAEGLLVASATEITVGVVGAGGASRCLAGRAEVVEGAPRPVPDHSAATDVQETADIELLVTDTRSEAAGPVRVRTPNAALGGIL